MNDTTLTALTRAAKKLYDTNEDTSLYVTTRTPDLWHARVPGTHLRERIPPTHAVTVRGAIFLMGYGPTANAVIVSASRVTPDEAGDYQQVKG